MKTVMCFGDSNTWGYDPVSGERLPFDVRWPGAMRADLGSAFHVIEEGLSGRTTVWDDPIEGSKNGRKHLIPLLQSHKPLDLVVIMLGTNDLKMRFSVSAFDVANSAGVLAQIARASGAGPAGAPPRILLVAPPPFAHLSDYAAMFEGGAAKSRALAGEFWRAAAEHGVDLLDAGEVIVSSDLDGIHFEAGEHMKLGAAVAARVRKMLA
jgi:lysophospholipase L1-like esterase